MNYDQTEMPESYDAGRAYAPEVLQRWLEIVADGVGQRQVSNILDLGCGTGRYSLALADYFDADVDAVDPSEKMLVQARRRPHPRVRFRRAPGEKLPLDDGSIDVVFISMSFHHFNDRPATLREVHRVLRPGGSVCMRAGTLEQISTYPYVPFFERSAAINESMLQSAGETVSLFEQGGFEFVSHELIRSEVAADWTEYVGRLAHRADSVLASLTDDEFQAGLDAARRHTNESRDAGPVVELIDFFVFRRRPKS